MFDPLLILSTLTIAVVILGLLKRYEPRMVLIAAGLFLCIIALKPMNAADAFIKSMTSAGLITAICSSMGFAFVMKETRCDMHLVRLLTAPLSGLGFFLIPITTALTFVINIAVISAAGCSAAVGATLIPVLIAAGVRPAMAAAAVFAGTFGSIISPGSAHTVFMAEMTGSTVMDITKMHSYYTATAGGLSVLFIAIMALVFKDYVPKNKQNQVAAIDQELQFKPNFFYAIGPLIPLILLIASTTVQVENRPYFEWLPKISVAHAMLIGVLYGLLITFKSPVAITKKFFDGMGSAYGDVIGLIIAASVFAAGLKAAGAVDSFISLLTENPTFARWGATIGPFALGALTGSGDAAAMAFNQAVTIHAADFGYQQGHLGMAAAIAGALGRTASPIAGGALVCAGIAGVNPIEMAKRTAPGVFVGMLFLALFML